VLRERGVVREGRDVFHLAIPVDDLDEAEAFYVGALGCKLARRYSDRITLDFFGDQLVCHLTDEPLPRASELSLYPRHFGVTFRESRDFDALYALCVQRKIELFADVRTRFDGLVEVHRTFVLRDPSDNLVEFKHYTDPRMMY
jgi:extradiol dioxygenase family protein